MHFGDTTKDSLHASDRAALRMAAHRFPAHAFSFESNDDGMVWAVFKPRYISDGLLRITICRIDPGLMVLVEDVHGRRQMRGLSTIEDALDFVHHTSEQASHLRASHMPASPKDEHKAHALN